MRQHHHHQQGSPSRPWERGNPSQEPLTPPLLDPNQPPLDDDVIEMGQDGTFDLSPQRLKIRPTVAEDLLPDEAPPPPAPGGWPPPAFANIKSEPSVANIKPTWTVDADAGQPAAPGNPAAGAHTATPEVTPVAASEPSLAATKPVATESVSARELHPHGTALLHPNAAPAGLRGFAAAAAPSFADIKPTPSFAGIKPKPSFAGIKPKPSFAGMKPKPSFADIKLKPSAVPVVAESAAPNATAGQPAAAAAVGATPTGAASPNATAALAVPPPERVPPPQPALVPPTAPEDSPVRDAIVQQAINFVAAPAVRQAAAAPGGVQKVQEYLGKQMGATAAELKVALQRAGLLPLEPPAPTAPTPAQPPPAEAPTAPAACMEPASPAAPPPVGWRVAEEEDEGRERWEKVAEDENEPRRRRNTEEALPSLDAVATAPQVWLRAYRPSH